MASCIACGIAVLFMKKQLNDLKAKHVAVKRTLREKTQQVMSLEAKVGQATAPSRPTAAAATTSVSVPDSVKDLAQAGNLRVTAPVVVSSPGGTRSRATTLTAADANDPKQRGHRRATSSGQVLSKLIKKSSWEERKGKSDVEDTAVAPVKRTVREGWIMMQDPSARRRLRSSKFLCKYMVVYKGGWVVFYDSAHCNPKEVGGWIALHQCDIDMSDHRDVHKSFVEVSNKNKQLIFHLSGPPALQDVVPPEYQPKVIWRKNCYRIKLRPTGEVRDGTLLEWTAALKEGIASSIMMPPPRPSTSGLTDPEDEEEPDSSEESSTTPMDDDDVPAASSSSRLPSTRDLSGHVHNPKNLSRQRSIAVIDPEADGPVLDDPDDAEPEKQGLMKMLSNAVGMDMTTIALPVSVHEPTSFLQRMAEGAQYWSLLVKADECQDPITEMAYVACFAVSNYSCNFRTSKPFNPYLGETFEFCEPEDSLNPDYSFIAEQVSHHPPVGAAFGSNKHFDFSFDQLVKTKFGGNSLDVTPRGSFRLKLKRTGHEYFWRGVRTQVNNIIIGSMWIDHFGVMEVRNTTTGEKAEINLTKCGWFGKGHHEVKGEVKNASGSTKIKFAGKVNERLVITSNSSDSKNTLKEGSVLWSNDLKCTNEKQKYLLSDLVHKMNETSEFLKKTLPETDSRFRKDRIALGEQDMNTAKIEKNNLEVRQRRLRAEREKSGTEWVPRFFTPQPDPDESDLDQWIFNHAYWKERADRVAKLQQ
eukprot:CAMPEP_0177677962 /NCGR_PEP_ID=MMETSP0447-20121125/28726_1 /TAXON_ID=0 /ORGANISM="Stygamoeba regulata, Strain BSH-02190019" /LENGTH=754 /DNA_ID=CAMNT_0019186875 /DNA_START=237 /DNA_END=2504 /DNA_ORIENTATION=-